MSAVATIEQLLARLARVEEETQVAKREAEEAKVRALRAEEHAAQAVAARRPRLNGEPPQKRASRRDLLRLAGSAAVGAAGAALLGAREASAADGQAILLGTAGNAQNHETTTTTIKADSPFTSGATALVVDATGAGGNLEAFRAIASGGFSGITAFGGGSVSTPGAGVVAIGGGLAGPSGLVSGQGVNAVGAGGAAGTYTTGGATNGTGLEAHGGGTQGTGVVAQGAITSSGTGGDGVQAIGGNNTQQFLFNFGGRGLTAQGGSSSYGGAGIVAAGGAATFDGGTGMRATGGNGGGGLNINLHAPGAGIDATGGTANDTASYGGSGVVGHGGPTPSTTSPAGDAVVGFGGNNTSGSGTGGRGLVGFGGSPFGAQISLAPASTPGPPTGGKHFVGDGWMDHLGTFWLCIAAGIPGTFTPLQAAGLNQALFTAVSTKQYTLSNSNGTAWVDMDLTGLSLSITPSFNCQAILSGNSDLWTSSAGFNQDLGITISGGAYPTLAGQPEAWKESGGFAGTFSPNAAFVEAVKPLLAGTTYTIKLQWKANKNAPSATIWAGAGPIPLGSSTFSPTRLTALLIVSQ